MTKRRERIQTFPIHSNQRFTLKQTKGNTIFKKIIYYTSFFLLILIYFIKLIIQIFYIFIIRNIINFKIILLLIFNRNFHQ